jgi:hypothetical protein
VNRRPLVLVASLVVLVCVAGRARAGALDPFGHPAGRTLRLDPFRNVAGTRATTTAANDPAVQTAPATGAPATPAPQSCQRDEDCTGDNICQSSVCTPIQLRTNVAYLYYRDGGFTELLGLYWSQKGSPGYRVVAPLYWHYWSPTTDTLIFAPFYWRFEDRAKRSLVTWYGPIVSGHQGDTHAFGLIPIFYASGTGSWAVPFLGTLRFKNPETSRRPARPISGSPSSSPPARPPTPSPSRCR